MREPRRGEVWLVDLGLAAKIRPCLILNVPASHTDRALTTIVPHTTRVRGSQFEAIVPAKFLKPGAFDAQGIVTIPTVKALRMLGILEEQQLATVESKICAWLGLPGSRGA